MGMAWAVNVDDDERVTLGRLVVRKLGLAEENLPQDVLLPLCQEIWDAPENAHLHQGDRDGASGPPDDIKIFPDEWIYLPVPWSTHVEIASVDPGNLSIDDVGNLIQTVLDNLHAAAPDGVVTGETLKKMPLNAGLRLGKAQSLVFYFRLPMASTAVDAAPSPPNGKIGNKSLATPDWLLPLWHFMDRLMIAADQVELAFFDVIDARAEGRFIAASVSMIKQFLAIVERDVNRDAPGARVLNPIAGMNAADRLNVSSLRTSMESLHQQCQTAFVAQPKYPVEKTHADSVKDLDKLLADPQLLKHYKGLDDVRRAYPGTADHLDRVLSRCASARAYAPDSDVYAENLEKAALQGQLAQDNVLLRRVVECFTKMTLQDWNDLGGAPFTTALGNVPGPRTIVVGIGKILMLNRIGTPQVFQTADAYATVLAKSYGLSASTTDDLIRLMNEQPPLQRVFKADIEAVEAASGNINAGAKLTGAVTVLSLLMFISAAKSVKSDFTNDTPALQRIADLAGAGSALAGSLGAMAQLINFAKTNPISATKLLYLGRVIGICGLLSGGIQMYQNWDKRDPKFWQGAGTVLMSSQPLLELAVTRFGPRLLIWAAIQLAPLIGGEAAAAAAATAAGLLAGLASAVTVVGGVILLAALIYSHREAINNFLHEKGKTGSYRLVAGYFDYIGKVKAFKTGPASVKAALKACVVEVENAVFVTFVPDAAAKKELIALGMNDADFAILDIAAPFEGLGIPMSGA